MAVPNVCCIVPPQILRRLRDQARDARERDALDQTLALTEQLRGERSVLGTLRAPIPAGELRRTVYDSRHRRTLPGTLVRSEGAAPADDAAVNEAYDNVGRVYAFFREIFRLNSVDDRGMRLDSSVHFARDFDNAFWNGAQMVFGDGHVLHGFTAALDVIAHEYTHGVTQFLVPGGGLVYQDQPGALNESISDVFGSLVKQWSLGQSAAQADWLIGATVVAPGTPPLRSMREPHAGLQPQPESMREYVETSFDNGGVHLNSGIPNRAFYLTATALGGPIWQRAGAIWFKALHGVRPLCDFGAFARATLDAASLLHGAQSRERAAVADSWHQVGVLD